MGELLATVIKLAAERLDLLVNDFVCSHIATLSECLATDVAAVRPFTCVPPPVRLEITQLRERLSASWRFAKLDKVLGWSILLPWMSTHEWLVTGVGADMSFHMSLFIEALVTVGDGALVTFPWLLSSLRRVVLFPS